MGSGRKSPWFFGVLKMCSRNVLWLIYYGECWNQKSKEKRDFCIICSCEVDFYLSSIWIEIVYLGVILKGSSDPTNSLTYLRTICKTWVTQLEN